jgi:hypothetical protein
MRAHKPLRSRVARVAGHVPEPLPNPLRSYVLAMASAIYTHFAQLFYLACEARDRCRRAEAEGRFAGDAIVAIIIATAALEAFVNDLTTLSVSYVDRTPEIVQPDPVQAFAGVLREAVEARVDIGSKYQLASSALSGRPFARHHQPYQDFAQLVRLRNWLIHLSPSAPRFVADFEQKQMTWPRDTYTHHTGAAVPVGMSDVDLISTTAVAQWACDASHHMIWAVLSMFPDGLADPADMIKRTFVRDVPDSIV